MSKPRASNHIVFLVPVYITDRVHEFTFIVVWMKLWSKHIPNKRGSSFRAWGYECSVRRNAGADHDWLVLSSKESQTDFRLFTSFHFIFYDSNAIVFWMNKKLVLLLWVNHYAGDSVIFKLFMLNYKLIRCMYLPLKYTYIPTSYKSYRISNKHSPSIIKRHTIRMNIICQQRIPHKVHIFYFPFQFHLNLR